MNGIHDEREFDQVRPAELRMQRDAATLIALASSRTLRHRLRERRNDTPDSWRLNHGAARSSKAGIPDPGASVGDPP